MNYAKLAFSDAAKRFQERYGSRASYARMEAYKEVDGLTESEIEFIAQQDNFFMATQGDNGFPYIQYRGGPKGFLKVIDEQTLGFIDFSGNKQYISAGNLTTNNKVALFLLDQAAKARLKVYTEAELLEIKDNAALLSKLNLGDYPHRPERIIILKVKGYDWNCPQHITERYTLEEISTEFSAQHDFINKLIEENKRLKSLLKTS